MDTILPMLDSQSRSTHGAYTRAIHDAPLVPHKPRDAASSTTSLDDKKETKKSLLQRFLPPPTQPADMLPAIGASPTHVRMTDSSSISTHRAEAMGLLAKGEVRRGLALLLQTVDAREALTHSPMNSPTDPKTRRKMVRSLSKYAEEYVLIANGEAVRRAAAIEPQSLVQHLYSCALNACLMDVDGTPHVNAHLSEEDPQFTSKYFLHDTTDLPYVLRALVLNNVAEYRRLSDPGSLQRVLRALLEALTTSRGVFCSVILYNIAATFLAMGRFDDAMEAVARCVELSQCYINACHAEAEMDMASGALVELCSVHIIDCHHLVATLAAWSGDTNGMERYHAQLAAGCAATYLHPTHPLQQRCLNRVASVESTRPPVPANDATRELVPPQLPLRPQGAVHAPRRFGTRVIPVSALLVCVEQVKVPRELQTYLSAVQRYISKTPLPPTPKTGDAHLIPQPPLLPSVRSRAAPPKKIERIITTVDRSSNDKYEQLKRSTAASLADPFLSEYLLCMDTELKRFSKIIVTDQKRKTKVTPHEAAKRIQCFYRRYRFRLHRRARSSERTEAPAAPLSPDSAARRIQTQYRLYRYRRGGRTKERTPHTRDSAATKIQAMWRMYVTRRQCAEKVQYLQWDRHVAATRIQRRWRCYWAQARCTDRWMMNLCHEKSSQASQHLMCSVIKIQSAVRMFLTRLHLLRRGVRCLQPVVWSTLSPAPKEVTPSLSPIATDDDSQPFEAEDRSQTESAESDGEETDTGVYWERFPRLSAHEVAYTEEEEAAALAIQRVWRGHAVRKRYVIEYEYYWEEVTESDEEEWEEEEYEEEEEDTEL